MTHRAGSTRRWIAALVAVTLPMGLALTAPSLAQARPAEADVVNGRTPVAGEFGFLAAIQATARPGESYVCGGSFVSSTQIVTAAHCFYDPDGRRMTTVSAAPGDGTTWPSNLISASKVDIHSGYSPSGESYDIALVTLSRPVLGVSRSRRWRSGPRSPRVDRPSSPRAGVRRPPAATLPMISSLPTSRSSLTQYAEVRGRRTAWAR